MKLSNEEKFAYSLTLAVVLLLGTYFYFNESNMNQNSDIKSNGITMKQSDIKAIETNFPNQIVRVCNLESEQCLVFYPFDKIMSEALK